MKRPNEKMSDRPVSCGLLLYKRDGDEIRYLVGLIPQRNFWTIFKGMPNVGESPEQTALREFEEETGSTNVLNIITPETVLKGTTGKKDLVIFLQEGSHVSQDCFNLENVVTIDQGYMKGKPEIVAIRWLTLSEALNGIDGARIYNSQQGILQEAQDFIISKYAF
jgi:8-oxo-dGTP pyrophosphatase MutT (NUDIX family)